MIQDYYIYDVLILRKTDNQIDDGGIPFNQYALHLQFKAHIEIKKIENKYINDKDTVKTFKRMICDVADITENDIAVIDEKQYEIKAVNNLLNRLMQIDILEKESATGSI